ncbi:MAG: hypothetical protein ABI681_13260, partial [Gemmatimonadales bacterium]
MCEAELASAGFDVTEEKFEYSQFPARWGPSIFGLLFAVTSWSAAHLAGRHQMPFAAFVTAAGGMLLLALLSRKLLVDGTSRLPWMRSQSGNLVATRRETNATPRIWLVAHIDSKSQTIPMLLRVAAVATSGILFTVMLASILAALALRTSAVSSTLGVRSESFLRAAQYEG